MKTQRLFAFLLLTCLASAQPFTNQGNMVSVTGGGNEGTIALGKISVTASVSMNFRME